MEGEQAEPASLPISVSAGNAVDTLLDPSGRPASRRRWFTGLFASRLLLAARKHRSVFVSRLSQRARSPLSLQLRRLAVFEGKLLAPQRCRCTEAYDVHMFMERGGPPSDSHVCVSFSGSSVFFSLLSAYFADPGLVASVVRALIRPTSNTHSTLS
ncbi:hypothetical protein NDU88_003448 [Pleurodeles waltl]|uniref:Uncharacterized protein n=1 Tax=Pleurodeles waltl TaxID=8319 RepID=A0AAV7V2H4_PLEWA|nr:hypothetical protein NDU88_003448 [Pleurodeles waltl]